MTPLPLREEVAVSVRLNDQFHAAHGLINLFGNHVIVIPAFAGRTVSEQAYWQNATGQIAKFSEVS